jgi:hypothetical protein
MMFHPFLAACSLGTLVLGASAQCWHETTPLVAPDAAAGDYLGWSVALDGDTAVVGSLRDDDLGVDSGSVYVFERHLGGPNAWGLARKLAASNGATGDQFGVSVALDGDTLLVGANFGDGVAPNTGTAYVFERDLGGAGNWGEAVMLFHPNGLGQLSDEYGFSVAIDGDTAVVGVPEEDTLGLLHAGSAWVYGRDQGGPGVWGKLQKLVPFDLTFQDKFGGAVAISGDTILVGAPEAGPGSAYVFERDLGGPNAWGEAKKVLPIFNLGFDFGISVALDGDRAVVGSWMSNLSGYDNGATFLFERDLGGAGNWGQSQVLLPSDGGTSSLAGQAVSIDADVVMVGASRDWPNRRGAVYSHERDLGGPQAWGQLPEIETLGGVVTDRFGWSVSLAGTSLLVGAPLQDSGGQDAGSAYLFEAWPPPVTAYCTAGQSISGCTAFVTACGTASASAPSGFNVWAGAVEGVESGLFFFAANGRQAVPWGASGYQCVTPPIRRTPVQSGLGEPNLCNGSFALDLNAHWTGTPNHNPGAGAMVQLQLWYRDPPGRRFSDAIEFTVGP